MYCELIDKQFPANGFIIQMCIFFKILAQKPIYITNSVKISADCQYLALMMPQKQITTCNKIAIIALICLLALLSHVHTELVQISTDANAGNDGTYPSFKEFVKEYGKKYEQGSDEWKKRQAIYAQTIERIKQNKKDPKAEHSIGITKFADQSQEQRQSKKKIYIDEGARKVALESPNKLSQQTGGIPSSLDWRQAGIITSIKDQGDCGACWTFATAAYGESRLVKNKTKTLDIDLSEQYLLSCTAECSCDGGYLEYVFEKAAGGIPLQADYPYNPYMPHSPFICWAGSKTYIGYIPQKFYDLSQLEMKKLLQTGPVAISISATNWQDYTGGVFKCRSFDKVNHAVLLVGYTPSFWIIKNQWGTKWGEQGYIRVSSDPLYNCKIGTSAFVMWENLNIFVMAWMILMIVVVL